LFARARVVAAALSVIVMMMSFVPILETVRNPMLDCPALPEVMMFRGGKQFAFLISWDDELGDLEFSFLEDALGMKHTSFVTTSGMGDKRLWGLDQMFRGHDIQSHAREHRALRLCNESYRDYLMRQSILDIQDTYGFLPILLAYPYGSTDDNTSAMALDYFKCARGTVAEGIARLGDWPITQPGNARHSTFDLGGLRGDNVGGLVERFSQMIAKGGYRAFKVYGHTGTDSFSAEEKQTLFEELAEIAQRDDTWYTSWGEAISYEEMRSKTVFDGYSINQTSLSFVVDADSWSSTPVTLRVPVREEWSTVTVIDGRLLVSRLAERTENGSRYVLFDTVPSGQRIVVTSNSLYDETPPVVSNARTVVTSEGTCIMFEVYDPESTIDQVNMAVIVDSQAYFFDEVQCPIFWRNGTYGRVVFGVFGEVSLTVCASTAWGVSSSHFWV